MNSFAFTDRNFLAEKIDHFVDSVEESSLFGGNELASISFEIIRNISDGPFDNNGEDKENIFLDESKNGCITTSSCLAESSGECTTQLDGLQRSNDDHGLLLAVDDTDKDSGKIEKIAARSISAFAKGILTDLSAVYPVLA